jgi:hypothetical protein
MRATRWTATGLAWLPLIAVAAGLSGCKTLSERYIALEVWKYERCFGHLPPGFVPPAAAQAQSGPPGRICGQAANCESCDPCQGGMASGFSEAGVRVPSGMGVPAGVGVPLGPGGSPGPAGVTAGRPIVISDEVVMP